MNCNGNIIVPELEQDACKGCLTTTDCINTVEIYPGFTSEITTLTAFMEKIVNKLDELEARVTILENNL